MHCICELSYFLLFVGKICVYTLYREQINVNITFTGHRLVSCFVIKPRVIGLLSLNFHFCYYSIKINQSSLSQVSQNPNNFFNYALTDISILITDTNFRWIWNFYSKCNAILGAKSHNEMSFVVNCLCTWTHTHSGVTGSQSNCVANQSIW